MPVKWEKKTKAQLRNFPKRMQNGSGSCVAQATEKQRGISIFLKYGSFLFTSASFTYQKRANTNVSGSTWLDCVKYAKMGSVPEVLMPSQSMTDEQMNNAPRPSYADDMARCFGSYIVQINSKDIEAIASTIQATGKGVGIWVRFGPGEWFSKLVVMINALLGTNIPWGHKVVAIDFYLNDKDEKCLWIDDSACEDGFQNREVNEDFLIKRCFIADYLVNFYTYAVLPERPHYLGTTTSLQDILKYEGLFPADQSSTGNWYAITDKAVRLFCFKYDIPFKAGRVMWAELSNKLLELYK